MTQLRVARDDGRYDRKLAKIAAADFRIMDDRGLQPLRPDEPADLYDIIRMHNCAVNERFPCSATRCLQASLWTD